MFTKADIEKYFNAEKAESFVFMGIALFAIVLALVFIFYNKTAFYKGAAIPMIGVGLLLGIVGYTVYNRSDEDRARNVYAYDMNPAELKEKEIPRMKTVMKNFIVYRYTEIALAIIGITLFIFYRNNEQHQIVAGIGTGLFIMALAALTADYFAEKRGHIYLDGLVEWVSKN